MWFDDVEVPSELIVAHREGRLVVFVGAGASRDAPSELPDFRQLTESIADQAHYPLKADDLLNPDIVLGRIKDRGVNVHRLVAHHLNPPNSEHNRLHEAILDLGLASPHLRIVTTNFDRHLSSAGEKRAAEFDEYAAPALPIGNDFTGLVYLHGTLSQPPERLVLTDGDFGKAYLRDAWAARFLERMFAEFSVLFIGYSHGDVVMRYLARALGPDGHRFVLTDKPEERDWVDLGLRPIGYEVDDGSHAALGEALARWAKIAGMGLLDHRQRVAELVAYPPSGIPEDETYLEELIGDPDRVGLFTEFARGTEWLDWVATKAVFGRLRDLGSHPSGTDRALAMWFVEFFVMDEDHTERALSLVSESGGDLGPEICHWIGFHLQGLKKPRPGWLGIWLVLLIRDASASDTVWLDYALAGSTWPDDREQVLLLFDRLTEPTVGLTSSFGLGPVLLDIQLRGNDYWLREAWVQTLRPNLPEVVHAVLATADRHLRRVRDLQVGAYPSNPGWDTVSFRRSAIEPHPQDRYTDPIDVLIDAAREGIEVLLDASDPMALGCLHAWAEADSPILRRLAVHGWTHRSDISPSAKLEWVVQAAWLADHPLHHEVFRLIAEAIPTSSDESIDALIAAVFDAADDERSHQAYKRYRLLDWMARNRPDHPAITAALTDAQAVNPSWSPEKDPDLTSSMEIGSVPSRPPMSVEDFRQQLKADPLTLLSFLQQFKGVSHWGGGPTWEDSLSLIANAVQAEPSDGLLILDVDPPDTEVTQAVINGWGRAELDPGAAAGVLERLAALDGADLVSDLVRLLSDGGRVEGHPTEWTRVAGARDLARDLWPLTPNDAVEPGGIDWLTRAINHPSGELAEFWIQVIQQDWSADEAGWSGLTPEHCNALETMLSGPPDETRTQMVEVICAGRLHFLFAADPGWTTRHVMPLLDWSDPSRAVRVWEGFIGWGRWNDRMLDEGLLKHYLDAISHLDEFADQLQQAILGHVAGIAITSDCDPLTWLPDFILDLSDDQRAVFAEKVADVLADLPSEAVEHQWTRWMRSYWESRLHDLPVQLSIDEASAMAGWIPLLTDSFVSGVLLVTRRPGRFREHSKVLDHLKRHVDDSANACAQMIGHLMQNTEPPWWAGYQLQELMPRLRGESAPEHLKRISENAIRLGLRDPGS